MRVSHDDLVEAGAATRDDPRCLVAAIVQLASVLIDIRDALERIDSTLANTMVRR